MTKTLLSTRNLRKSYGKRNAKFDALRGINISIQEGESVAIIGKSGSGKSTLMHLLALLDKPSAGTIMLHDKNTSSLSGRKLNRLRNKEFGFVFQSFFMNANDSVLNNVILPLKIAGVGMRERKRRAINALKIVELEDKMHNKANDLSGGQKQRVCIARAIVNNPKVIFADEPTGNLDSVTGDKIMNLLFKLNQEKGITLIIVTHDQELANKCERQIHIKDGKIVSDTETEKAAPAKAPEAKTAVTKPAAKPVAKAPAPKLKVPTRKLIIKDEILNSDDHATDFVSETPEDDEIPPEFEDTDKNYDDDGDEEIAEIVEEIREEEEEGNPEAFEGDNNIDGMLDRAHIAKHISIIEDESDEEEEDNL